MIVIKYHDQRLLMKELNLANNSRGLDVHNDRKGIAVEAGSGEITSQLHTGSKDSKLEVRKYYIL